MRLTFDMETTARLPKLKGAVTPSRHHERRVGQVAPTMSVVPSKNDPDYGYYLLFCKNTLLQPDQVASNPASLAAWKAYLVRLKEELQTVTLMLLIQCQEAKKKMEAKALELADAVEARKIASTVTYLLLTYLLQVSLSSQGGLDPAPAVPVAPARAAAPAHQARAAAPAPAPVSFQLAQVRAPWSMNKERA